jgi:hypothetical protein
MVKELCELSRNERKLLIENINKTMVNEFDISLKSIDIFWNIFETGAHMHDHV